MSTELVAQVERALATVNDPELRRPLTELGMVESVAVADGVATVGILLTISGCPMRDRLGSDIAAALEAISGIESVQINFGVMSDEQREAVKKLLRGGREKFNPFAQEDSLTLSLIHI